MSCMTNLDFKKIQNYNTSETQQTARESNGGKKEVFIGASQQIPSFHSPLFIVTSLLRKIIFHSSLKYIFGKESLGSRNNKSQQIFSYLSSLTNSYYPHIRMGMASLARYVLKVYLGAFPLPFYISQGVMND